MSQFPTSVQHKRGDGAALAAHNPLLAEGELGAELDANRLKLGDGINNWNDLPYLGNILVDTIAKLVADNPVIGKKNLAVGYNNSTGERQFKLSFADSAANVRWNSLPEVPIVFSNTQAVLNSTRVKNVVALTEAQYTALATKDASTLYILIE